MSGGSKINLTFLHVDIEYDEYECGGEDCTCDYVEILGQRYCGNSSLSAPIISCSLEVIFQSDSIYRFPGFRAEWTEIPDDGEWSSLGWWVKKLWMVGYIPEDGV